MTQAHQFVLTMTCPDAKGIVHAISGLLYQAGCNIIDSQQFGDLEGVVIAVDPQPKGAASSDDAAARAATRGRRGSVCRRCRHD
jgi:formyltetrahydrofolate hydrolase